MQKKKIKEYILGGIVIIIALLTLIGMAFNLTQAEDYKDIEKIPLSADWHASGFSMLKFESDLIPSGDFEWGNAVLGVLNLLHLLSCIIAIGLVIASFIVAKDKKKLFNIIAIVISVAFSVLYMIEGIVFTTICGDEWQYEFKTIAFVPLILVAVFVAIYFIVDKMYVVDGAEGGKEVQSSEQASEPAAKKVDVVQLKQLKELLDMGAITQEEYDSKKKDILNN